jgi:hypothetical protein
MEKYVTLLIYCAKKHKNSDILVYFVNCGFKLRFSYYNQEAYTVIARDLQTSTQEKL